MTCQNVRLMLPRQFAIKHVSPIRKDLLLSIWHIVCLHQVDVEVIYEFASEAPHGADEMYSVLMANKPVPKTCFVDMVKRMQQQTEDGQFFGQACWTTGMFAVVQNIYVLCIRLGVIIWISSVVRVCYHIPGQCYASINIPFWCEMHRDLGNFSSPAT